MVHINVRQTDKQTDKQREREKERRRETQRERYRERDRAKHLDECGKFKSYVRVRRKKGKIFAKKNDFLVQVLNKERNSVRFTTNMMGGRELD